MAGGGSELGLTEHFEVHCQACLHQNNDPASLITPSYAQASHRTAPPHFQPAARARPTRPRAGASKSHDNLLGPQFFATHKRARDAFLNPASSRGQAEHYSSKLPYVRMPASTIPPPYLLLSVWPRSKESACLISPSTEGPTTLLCCAAATGLLGYQSELPPA